MKYNTLKELIDAYNTGELSQNNILYIDNNDASVAIGSDEDDTYECVFSMHPFDLFVESLKLHGIPAQSA